MPEYLETKIDKFTFKVAVDRFYTPDVVWALAHGTFVRIGLSDFLQQRSGDIAFAEMKPEGTVLVVGDEVASIETIKININLTSPAAGSILQINPLMGTAPETINQDPYGEGWLCDIEAADWEADQKKLLEPAVYFAHMNQAAESEVKKE